MVVLSLMKGIIFALFLGVAVLAATVVLTGCGVPPSDRYAVYVDSAMTAAQSEAVLAAVDDWCSRVPVYVTVNVAPCKEANDREIRFCTATHGDLERLDGSVSATTLADTLGTTVYLDVVTIPENDLQGVAAHEMGHAMGLVHWSGSAEQPLLMNPAQDDRWSRSVACGDAQQWYYVRHAVSPGC
jgi:hypothetical protein